MMTQKLLYLLPLFLLSGCGQATYKNASLPAEERAGLLLKELTLEEKVSLMMDSSKPVERLGIKPYNWWNEALHGVARAGLATVFPQPIGMAASFSPETVYEVFTAVSDEARAKNAYYASQGSRERYQGLTMDPGDGKPAAKRVPARKPVAPAARRSRRKPDAKKPRR